MGTRMALIVIASEFEISYSYQGETFSGVQVNIWKFIYLNCGEWYEDIFDHRSYTLNLSSWEIKAWKNIHRAIQRAKFNHDMCPDE